MLASLSFIIAIADPLGTIKYRASYRDEYVKAAMTFKDTDRSDTVELRYSLLGIYSDTHRFNLNNGEASHACMGSTDSDGHPVCGDRIVIRSRNW